MSTHSTQITEKHIRIALSLDAWRGLHKVAEATNTYPKTLAALLLEDAVMLALSDIEQGPESLLETGAAS